jgi:hypothetical protein
VVATVVLIKEKDGGDPGSCCEFHRGPNGALVNELGSAAAATNINLPQSEV